MNLTDFAKHVWEKSDAVEFGSTPDWDAQLLSHQWATGTTMASNWATYGPGWYWFLVEQSYAKLSVLARPENLPRNGCDIGSLSQTNTGIFGESLLCQPDTQSRIVVYNGHADKVSSRVRAHFALDNNGTGALGLKHFPLSESAWVLRIFSTPQLNSLDGANRPRLHSLMTTASGRCAVEAAWRISFGWPVLCKE